MPYELSHFLVFTLRRRVLLGVLFQAAPNPSCAVERGLLPYEPKKEKPARRQFFHFKNNARPKILSGMIHSSFP